MLSSQCIQLSHYGAANSGLSTSAMAYICDPTFNLEVFFLYVCVCVDGGFYVQSQTEAERRQ